MKKTKVTSVLAITAAAVLALSSCQKNQILPVGTNSAENNSNAKGVEANNAKTPYDEGFRSITSLTSGVAAKIGYVKMVVSTYTNQGATARNFDLGGDAISATTSLCYGAAVTNGVAKEAVVYNGADGYARISVATGIPTNAYSGSTSNGGSGVPIMINNNVTTLRFEEIEINPADGQVYGIVKASSVNLYRIATDGSGVATLMTYNGSYSIFNNTFGNGYKSGSISFVEMQDPAFPLDPTKKVYQLAYATESNVYASLGIVVWRYNVVGSTIVVDSGNNRTYNTTAIPAGTAKINTASVNGQIYFARDNGAMYKLGATNNTATPVAISPANIANSNDFGYYKAF